MGKVEGCISLRGPVISLLLIASASFMVSCSDQEREESYLEFAQLTSGPFLFDDKVSLGIYRTARSHGIAVGEVGLGDGGQGVVVTVIASCDEMKNVVPEIEFSYKLKLKKCSQINNR